MLRRLEASVENLSWSAHAAIAVASVRHDPPAINHPSQGRRRCRVLLPRVAPYEKFNLGDCAED